MMASAPNHRSARSALECGNDIGSSDMATRIAKLESHVEHIRSDVADIKHEQRTLRSGLTDMSKWALGLYIVLASGLLGVMAKGFGWL